MRWHYLFLTVCAACAASNEARPADPQQVVISLARDTSAARPTLVVEITNRSSSPICISADAIRNPYSYGMDFKLRDAAGRAIKHNKPGYIEPPLPVQVQVQPGTTDRGQYYLYPRFKIRTKTLSVGWSAKASFPYKVCNSSTPLRATSTWQGLR